MRILNGWKEIAECLHLTSRTAQRWERLGLPVRRVSNSSRSPTIAFSDEIENWARTKDRKLDAFDSCAASVPAYRATRVETQKLVDELRTARMEHRKLLSAIRNQIAVARKISFDWTTS